jgi:hypothetical protein
VAPFPLNLQEICSEYPPFVAETLGFPFREQQNLQRICNKSGLQILCRGLPRALNCDAALFQQA